MLKTNVYSVIKSNNKMSLSAKSTIKHDKIPNFILKHAN